MAAMAGIETFADYHCAASCPFPYRSLPVNRWTLSSRVLGRMTSPTVLASPSFHRADSLGDEPLSPPTTPQPTSKKHQKASTTFALMTQNFMATREPTFTLLLKQIQSRLSELHEGDDEEYRQQIAVLEDARDKELLEVEAARGFALERAEREYQEEKRLAEKEFTVRLLLSFLSVPFAEQFSSWAKRKQKTNCWLR
jgi:hypothetical protein